MTNPNATAGALIEKQLGATLDRDVFTAAEVQDFLFELWSALHAGDEPAVEAVPALA